jgi:uncharacterized protein (TIRG00374 family)
LTGESKVSLQEESVSPAKGWQPRDWLRNGLALTLGIGIGLVALWLAVRGVDFEQILALVLQSDVVLELLAFGAVMSATVVTLLRWQQMLRPYPTDFLRLFRVFLIAHLLNTLLPAKLGTGARICLAAESEQVNVGFVFGTVTAEKVIDTLAMLIVFLVLMLWVPLPEWLRDTLMISTAGVIVAFVALVGVRRVGQAITAWLARIEHKYLGGRSWKLSAAVGGLVESSQSLLTQRRMLALWGYTGVVWLAGGLANQLLLYAMGLDVPWTAAWFLLVVLQLGTRVPSLPANIGVFHYLVILALGLYTVNGTQALGYALVLHLLVFILPALLGVLCLVHGGVSFGQLLWSGLVGKLSSGRP